jgi:hypothetical protein
MCTAVTMSTPACVRAANLAEQLEVGNVVDEPPRAGTE